MALIFVIEVFSHHQGLLLMGKNISDKLLSNTAMSLIIKKITTTPGHRKTCWTSY